MISNFVGLLVHVNMLALSYRPLQMVELPYLSDMCLKLWQQPEKKKINRSMRTNLIELSGQTYTDSILKHSQSLSEIGYTYRLPWGTLDLYILSINLDNFTIYPCLLRILHPNNRANFNSRRSLKNNQQIEYISFRNTKTSNYVTNHIYNNTRLKKTTRNRYKKRIFYEKGRTQTAFNSLVESLIVPTKFGFRIKWI